ncbi:MAG: Rrf2 family transcriptional regulator [Actinomycetes bacterium]|jgi:Rrf2 family protein|nr:Rrf2 family transcriptional regulator [Actinomycetes bacterium]
MEITRRTDYAVRIMRAIAECESQEPISVRAISEQDGVPYQFARRISYDLTGAGLIKVTRGARGGAVLAYPAKDITLYDIVKVGQGEPICSRCVYGEDWCNHEENCLVREGWKELDKIVAQYLKSVTLADVCTGKADCGPGTDKTSAAKATASKSSGTVKKSAAKDKK